MKQITCDSPFLLLTLSFLGLLGSSTVFAEETFYTNLKFLDIEFEADTPQPSGKFDANTAARFEFGYRLNEYVALVVGVNRFKEIKESNVSTDGLAWDTDARIGGYTLGLKGFFPMGERAEFWVSGGMFSWDVDYDITFTKYPGLPSNATLSGVVEDEGRDQYFSAGIDFLLAPELHFTIEAGKYRQRDVFENINPAKTSDFEQNYIGFGFGTIF